MSHLFSVMLRVPPLFIMDELLLQDLGIPFDEELETPMENPHINIPAVLTKLTLYINTFLIAAALFTLPIPLLVKAYKVFLILGCVTVSYLLPEFTSNYISFGTGVSIQVSLGITYCLLMSSLSLPFQFKELAASLFWIPNVIQVQSFPIRLLTFIIPLLGVNRSHLSALSRDVSTLVSGSLWVRDFITSFGLHAFMEMQWARLKVPRALRYFWILRSLAQIHGIISQMDVKGKTNVEIFTEVAGETLTHGCDTFVAVMGMTAVISSLCHFLGTLFQKFLQYNSEEHQIGTISAIMFFILALQTGLSGLSTQKRLNRLLKNMCLLFTAVLHFAHNMLNPVLMSLSASQSPSVWHHTRAIIVSLVLISTPIILINQLWTYCNLSTWLLAVSAFSIEVIVKVLVSLSIYTLFLVDSRRDVFWENLDDYVYYIRAFGNTVEFIFGIFLFLNGVWILVFESGGAIRATMMCIHAYFNIWCEARHGWHVFIKRRTAVNKINSLPDATKEQLENFNDICAICYQTMNSAKITRCQHFFHSLCLRKWLYVQDRCPLCHKVLYKSKKSESRDEGSEAHEEEEIIEEGPGIAQIENIAPLHQEHDD